MRVGLMVLMAGMAATSGYAEEWSKSYAVSGSPELRVNGHVTLRMPQGLGAMRDAHTGDGSITVDFPITIEGGTLNKRDVRGKINGGGETIQIHTGDGAIRVEKT